MKTRKIWFSIAAITMIIIGSCDSGHEKKPEKKEKEFIVHHEFDADSAYHFVEKQVAFGPRVPGSQAHENCRIYLTAKLSDYADKAIVQPFKARVFNGTIMNGYNIIGSFDTLNTKRILLCAHWDSRPFADYDPDPEKHNQAIDGANDGASGVGVLLEAARQFKIRKPGIGVDIIFFDLEDYGEPSGDQFSGKPDTWGLGSQYWSRNPHKPGYTARFGMLLDMVGNEEATFLMEGFSMEYAPKIVRKVWTIAGRIGFSNYFLFKDGGYITDDHYYINKITGIPTINIIHLTDKSPNGSFFNEWHTISDNMAVIDRKTLQVVGLTVLNTVYNE
ncbi:MAG: M28 family peptidase [Bacteroidales bacterium]|nr:M28 family peptidase [Bacteroidales bacterium]